MLSGCVFLGDLLAPDVAASLGVPAPAQSIGSVVVRVKNDTTQQAVLSVLAGGVTAPANLSADTAAGGSENFVLDCPVGFVRPAGVAAGVSVSDLNSAAASVIAADGMTIDVTYTGSTLESDATFDCGDVIEVSLVQTGTDIAAANFAIIVQVIKGS